MNRHREQVPKKTGHKGKWNGLSGWAPRTAEQAQPYSRRCGENCVREGLLNKVEWKTTGEVRWKGAGAVRWG